MHSSITAQAKEKDPNPKEVRRPLRWKLVVSMLGVLIILLVGIMSFGPPIRKIPAVAAPTNVETYRAVP